jgi:queuine tRNA-ribosyltransferase
MSYPNFSFTINATHGRARTGLLSTPHGAVETPNFIFCATKAAIKGLTMAQMREAGAAFVLANTYHLMLQPGAEVVERQGGLQKFTGWNGPMLTDSGGFQIFSMGHGSVADEIKGKRAPQGSAPRAQSLLKITEEGAEFRSYVDGAKQFLTPERSMDIQRRLGADFILQLDECTPFHVDRAYTARSMGMSHRWGDRSLAEFKRQDDGRQAVYGIVQGGVYPDLRRESSAYTKDRDFFGTAIGGSLGASKEQMYEVVAMCMDYVHEVRPVHLLGIGGIGDVFAGVRLGIDTFDCVSPTRIARHGWALCEGGESERLNLRNARYRDDTGPLDAKCSCYACRTAGRAYIHHLIKAGEMTGMILLSIHNVATMTRLMRDVRAGIQTGTLDEVQKRWQSGKANDT